MDIKGVAIVATRDFIIKKFGNDGLTRWLDSLNPDAKAVYSSNILPSKWYDLTNIGSIPRQKICDLFYDGNPDGCIELGVYSAQYSLKGIYGILIKLRSIDYLVKTVARATSLYYRPSRYEVWDRKPNEVIIRITLFPEPHKVMEYTNLGYIKGALEICGYKNIQVELEKSLTDGDEFSELIVSWD